MNVYIYIHIYIYIYVCHLHINGIAHMFTWTDDSGRGKMIVSVKCCVEYGFEIEHSEILRLDIETWKNTSVIKCIMYSNSFPYLSFVSQFVGHVSSPRGRRGIKIRGIDSHKLPRAPETLQEPGKLPTTYVLYAHAL